MARSSKLPARTTISVQYRFAGKHCWPKAPESAAYLRSLHRHQFHVRVECLVKHNDRDVEFHTLQWAVGRVLIALYPLHPGGVADCANDSCETIAAALLCELRAQFYAVSAVECSEDGENGARVEVVR